MLYLSIFYNTQERRRVFGRSLFRASKNELPLPHHSSWACLCPLVAPLTITSRLFHPWDTIRPLPIHHRLFTLKRRHQPECRLDPLAVPLLCLCWKTHLHHPPTSPDYHQISSTYPLLTQIHELKRPRRPPALFQIDLNARRLVHPPLRLLRSVIKLPFFARATWSLSSCHGPV